MIQTHGYAAQSAGAPLAPFSFERCDLRERDVLIEIQYCGICHSDIHQARNEWSEGIFPMVPGHEIVGTVQRVGAQVSRFKPGDRVGVGCLVDSCRRCAHCQQGLEQYCLNGNSPTYNGLEQDGVTPTYGGYSRMIVVDEAFVLRVPETLELSAVAPLLCAGITTYSPLRHWQVGPGQKVGIMGLGGLGHMGVKLAHSFGAHTVVITTSPHKAADALKLGADEVLISRDDAQMAAHAESFDFLLNTISAQHDLEPYLNLLKLDGTMVLVGVPEVPPALQAINLISRRRRIAGSLIGGLPETQEMLDYCGQHGIVSEVEVIPIQQVNEAYERMIRSDVRYRFVIEMKSLESDVAEHSLKAG
jgi:uncharacterized zinc-type alcohol dehydrogenase-like protein